MSRVVERAVNDDSSTVYVRAVERGADRQELRVTWFCGDARQFTAEFLADVIDYLDLLTRYPGVWLSATDAYGARFVARVEDGQLQAGARLSDASQTIEWDAVKQTVAEMMPA